MKRNRVLAAFAACLSVGLAVSGCSSSDDAGADKPAADCKPAHDFDTLKDGELQVAVYVSPPYTQTPASPSEVGGVDGAIVGRFAEMECLSLNAQAIAPAAAIEAVKTKRVDMVIGGIVGSPERAEFLGLSDPIYRIRMAFVSKAGVSTVDEAGKGTIGVVQGYRWNEDFQKAFGSKVKTYQTLDALVSDLANGRVDTGVLDDGEAMDALKRKGDDGGLKVVPAESDQRIQASVTPAEVVLVSTFGNNGLTDAINGDLDTMRQAGELATFIKDAGLSPDALIE